MAQVSIVHSLRVGVDRENDFYALEDWASKHQKSFTGLIRSIMPALRHACENHTHEKDGKVYIVCDFGAVEVIGASRSHVPRTHRPIAPPPRRK